MTHNFSPWLSNTTNVKLKWSVIVRCKLWTWSIILILRIILKILECHNWRRRRLGRLGMIKKAGSIPVAGVNLVIYRIRLCIRILRLNMGVWHRKVLLGGKIIIINVEEDLKMYVFYYIQLRAQPNLHHRP